MERIYLGDGVYASFDGQLIAVWKSNGIKDSETIWFERETYYALRAFGAKVWELKP